MSSVAIIPARGGSKRVPRKNVIDFAGKPLIAWTIEAAHQTGLFDKVIVSTDDAEIADVSRAHGAEVPFLRNEFGDDHSPVSLATVETLQRLEAECGWRFDTVAQLFAVCPLRTADDIRAAMERFRQTNAQFQISCFDYGWFHPWWAHKVGPEGQPEPLFPEVMKGAVRSQDLPPLYCPTGATWLAKVAPLVAAKTFYGPDHRFFPMSWQHAIDIDTHEDVEMALLLRQIEQAKGAAGIR